MRLHERLALQRRASNAIMIIRVIDASMADNAIRRCKVRRASIARREMVYPINNYLLDKWSHILSILRDAQTNSGVKLSHIMRSRFDFNFAPACSVAGT